MNTALRSKEYKRRLLRDTIFQLKRSLHIQGFVNYLSFSIKTFINLPEIFRYQGETFRQIYVLGNQVLPLILISSVFVSMALGIEWAHQLERFGAKTMIGGVLANAMIRQIGPLVVGLLIAARTSAEITSELGFMVLTEQIDALEAFGTDTIKRLIVPRQFACIIVMVPLTILADALGIIAGWFATTIWAGTDSQAFWISAVNILFVKDLIVGTVKPLFYGIFIGSISTYFGYMLKGRAENMGQAISQAIRYSAISVLFIDFLFTKVIHSF